MAGRSAASSNTLPVVLPLLRTYWGLNTPNLPLQSKIQVAMSAFIGMVL